MSARRKANRSSFRIPPSSHLRPGDSECDNMILSFDFARDSTLSPHRMHKRSGRRSLLTFVCQTLLAIA